MDAISKTNETSYRFRFGTTKKTIQITQQQLNHFPYLFALVSHTDDFSVNKNDDDEYILEYPICYNWFMVIFQSIIKEQPSALFTELTHEANVLRMLELYDYLCIDPLPLPLLKNQKLVLTNPIDVDGTNKHIEWCQADICEVRNIAIQFIIGISKNAYNLNDFGTINSIFTLLMAIFSNPNIFHSRFRYHTLKIIKKYCFSLFSDNQQKQLPTTQQIIQNINIDFIKYLDNKDQSLPPNFNNTFAWKGIYVSKDKVDTDLQSIGGIYRFKRYFDLEDSVENNFYLDRELSYVRTSLDRSAYFMDLQAITDCISALYNAEPFVDIESLQYDLQQAQEQVQAQEQAQAQERKKNEAQSARSRRFNTLPKWPKFDKFKHRSGPKAQKYR
ncbi:unnamed protein product [Adineta steineri]|uniref:Uncharacterized protein n=1 Tax=Adineta steineri TaxID=433720 RepID=A0A813MSN8_9BILA|nr:unnamed protein product [Adineta steineri]CAF4005205.1 unnamed protein product [Adineta steineri]